jgi:hypothetical protein
MQTLHRAVTPISATNRSAVSNRTRLLDGVDGRSAGARRFRDICRAYEAEAGGQVSEVERDLIRQAAGLTLRAEQLQAAVVRGDAVDGDHLIRLASTAKRVLGAIAEKAAKRKPATPRLSDHLARRAAGLAGAVSE